MLRLIEHEFLLKCLIFEVFLFLAPNFNFLSRTRADLHRFCQKRAKIMENANFSPKIYIFTHEMLNASSEKSNFNRSPVLGFICMIRYVRCPVLLPQNNI